MFRRLFKKNTDPSSSPGIGSVVNGRYRLEAELGRGGMGIVFRAHDLAQQREVAFKIIKLDGANALSLGQFSREAEIGLKLEHPHIVRVYETGTIAAGPGASAPFIAMELVQGRPLTEVKGFTIPRILDIGAQVCEALEYAHEQGIVYRDLKPGNVVLERRGFKSFVKLLDFGLARPRGEANLPLESNLAGTVFYLAPEVIAGMPSDIGSDLYALGATLYEMLTGRVPFSNIDEQNILNQHLEEAVPPPSQSRDDIPPALEAIVLKLLEKDPRDRFASAHEVRAALLAVPPLNPPNAGNLPRTGRTAPEAALSQVRRMLEEAPLVTILKEGPLVLAAAESLAAEFPDGAWLVEMDRVASPDKVLQTAAEALGVQAGDRPLTVSLVAALRDRKLLLVLDHVGAQRGACAQLITTLLRTCPEVRILAQSPKPFLISGELVF